MKRILLTCAVLTLALAAAAQKKPLDHSVYDRWQSVGSSILSPDGNVVAYEVNPQEGDGVLTLRVFGKKGREIVIPRGYRTSILDDGTFAVCLIRPEFQKTRRARIAKKKGDDLPKDSLAVIDLRTGAVTRFSEVKGYKIGKHAAEAFAFMTADTTDGPLAVYHFGDGSIDTLRNIDGYAFSKDGAHLGLVRKTGKKASVAGFYDVASRKAHFLTDTTAWHGVPVWDESGARALYLEARDSATSGSKHATLHLYEAGTSKCIIGSDNLKDLPEDWGLTENSTIRFSHDGRRIFAGVQEFTPPKDTSLVPFETAGLDIWNWDAAELPPRQKSSLERDRKHTFTAVLHDGRLLPLYTSKLGRLQEGNRGDGDYALYVESTDPVETQWNTQNEVRLSLVSQEDASRKEIATGVFDRPSLSPEGGFVLWWDCRERGWTLYDIASGSARNLTAETGVNFWDEEDDHPMYPEAYGVAGWSDGDREVLLYDRYDIWVFPTSGAAPRRLTEGRGKGLTYRYINTKDREEDRTVHPGETLLLSVFDNATKENGIATVAFGGKGGVQTPLFGGWTFNGVQKARKADVFLYRKGNFREPYDLWHTASLGRKDLKLTAINPQIDSYNWGTVELYRWTAFDGKPLEGLLYRPEDFDPAKKYPVMIYFYEKNSENLYTHYAVQPSWSIINIPFYVSRGYIVFVPDIVFTPGLPGESARNCIVSGAESLAKFPWADAENMAIQGQSWGGYEVAWLITRTGMFKAAGAGAPVANMTSAYGGIRWESGMSRQFQYEQTQSRIGRDLWNGLELYLENSPLFRLPDVTTPVLIMHNDADGAVPWYQGIELFMGLRRLGKPAWLLEYNDESHNLRERRNRKDLSIRLQQFFDHYLKGTPEPAWMRDGVPTLKKDRYFGLEDAD